MMAVSLREITSVNVSRDVVYVREEKKRGTKQQWLTESQTNWFLIGENRKKDWDNSHKQLISSYMFLSTTFCDSSSPIPVAKACSGTFSSSSTELTCGLYSNYYNCFFFKFLRERESGERYSGVVDSFPTPFFKGSTGNFCPNLRARFYSALFSALCHI